MSKELAENNHWIDNQQALVESLEETNREKVVLERRVLDLENRVRRMLLNRRRERAQAHPAVDGEEVRMSFTQSNVNALFNINDNVQPQD